MSDLPIAMVMIFGLALGVYGLFEKRRYDRLTREIEEAEAERERKAP